MRLLIIFFVVLINSAESQNVNEIKLPLIDFLRKLSPSNPLIDSDLGWIPSSDPCLNRWRGISCNNRLRTLRSIELESLSLSGSIDGKLLSIICNSSSLSVLSLKTNSITGNFPPEIALCSQLTQLYISNNRLSGSLPSSLPNLRNLKRIDLSNNNFSGHLPWNLSKISGLVTFVANNNYFDGNIPDFDLIYFNQFNVSANQFSGPLPSNSVKFPISSFTGNPGLCGKPLDVPCPPPSSSTSKSKNFFSDKLALILGYVLFGLSLFLLLVHICQKKKKKQFDRNKPLSDSKVSDSGDKTENVSRSEFSISSVPAMGTSSSSLVVLSKDDRKKDLKFEDLLRAPAELMGKGRFGSLYKVLLNGGETKLAVKRIKDWTVTGEEFQRKIIQMNHTSHPNVLPVTAFYFSKQEKLVVYEYQSNGSLFNLLHDNKAGVALKWPIRLNLAACVSAGLAHMHENLENFVSGAGHGNLKSSNILLSSFMEPLISEYGLTALPSHRIDSKSPAATDPFSTSVDVYSFGVVLLELLTGKPSHGFDLVNWVHSVVREEWTVEVFDRRLLSGDANDHEIEEEMVKLLRVALHCIDGSLESRCPSMAEVAAMIEGLNDDKS